MSKTIYRSEHRALVALVRKGREERQLTQAEVASRMGLRQARISDFERGGRRLDIIEYLDYCGAVGLDPIETLELALATARKAR